MNLTQLDQYFKNLLNIQDFVNCDNSKNGIQVQNNCDKITKVAFAVDASLETFKRAQDINANVVFVHHGMFWGHEQTITNILYERIAFLIKHNIALYACHLPLDAHPIYGNNASLAALLDLQEREDFAVYHGKKIGVKGRLPQELSPEEVLNKVFPDRRTIPAFLPFGKQKVSTVGIVSGGAADDVMQAIDENLDMYITGEASHTLYHTIKESKVNFLAGGHYQSETGGVKAVAAQLGRDTGIETVFLDIPTNL